MDEVRIVELTGAVTGRYEVAEERADGTVVLSPDTSVDAIMRRVGSTPASEAEFEAAFGDLPTAPARALCQASRSGASKLTPPLGMLT